MTNVTIVPAKSHVSGNLQHCRTLRQICLLSEALGIYSLFYLNFDVSKIYFLIPCGWSLAEFAMLLYGTFKGAKLIALFMRSLFDLLSAISLLSQLPLLTKIDAAGYTTFVFVFAAYLHTVSSIYTFSELFRSNEKRYRGTCYS